MAKNKTKRTSKKTTATRSTAKKKISYSKRFSRYSNIKKAFLFAVAFAVVATAVLIITHAAASPYDDVKQASLVDNPARGLIYKGLKAVKANANHPCKGIFEIEGAMPNGNPLCTHGPDPTPDDTDLSAVTPETRLEQLSRVPLTETTSAQLQANQDPELAKDLVYGPFTNTYPLSPVPCTSGKYRIQLVVISHVADTSTVMDQLKHTARRMESQLEYSALHSGPGSTNRYFRFVTDSTCHPTVIKVRPPDSYSLANPHDVTTYLADHGYKDSYTKYLVWDYANVAKYCGIGTAWGDSNPRAVDNVTNKNTGYAVIGIWCLGSSAEMHEIMHTLGAVNNDAPHASGALHCLDQHDEMCYNDHNGDCTATNGTTFQCGANGKPLYVAPNCLDPSLQWLLDCGKNDYFRASTVSPTNYLYNHWNVANSPYMQR